MRTLLATVLGVVIAQPAGAQNFSCRNEKAEIRCAADGCSIETDSFTPMSLTRNGGKLSVCAYSGCSEGPIVLRRTRGGITMLSADVRRNPRERGSVLAVIYDHAERTAMMRWEGFSNVMHCGG